MFISYLYHRRSRHSDHLPFQMHEDHGQYGRQSLISRQEARNVKAREAIEDGLILYSFYGQCSRVLRTGRGEVHLVSNDA